MREIEFYAVKPAGTRAVLLDEHGFKLAGVRVGKKPRRLFAPDGASVVFRGKHKNLVKTEVKDITGDTGGVLLHSPTWLQRHYRGTPEGDMLSQLNQYRISQGADPLYAHPRMTQLAESHAHDMATKDYFAHSTNGYGENIAAGFSTARAAMLGFKNSPGHNTNMIYRGYDYAGIGYVQNPASTYSHYWNQTFL